MTQAEPSQFQVDTSPERPVGAILKDLVEHTQELAKQELKLASAELDQKISAAKADLLAPALGACVLYAGVLCLLAALVLALARIMPPWAAAALVGALVTGLGYALIKRAQLPDPRLKRVPPNVRADVQTFEEATK